MKEEERRKKHADHRALSLIFLAALRDTRSFPRWLKLKRASRN